MKAYKSATQAKRAAYAQYVSTNVPTMVVKEELTESQKKYSERSYYHILPACLKDGYENDKYFTIIAIYNEL